MQVSSLVVELGTHSIWQNWATITFCRYESSYRSADISEHFPQCICMTFFFGRCESLFYRWIWMTVHSGGNGSPFHSADMDHLCLQQTLTIISTISKSNGSHPPVETMHQQKCLLVWTSRNDRIILSGGHCYFWSVLLLYIHRDCEINFSPLWIGCSMNPTRILYFGRHWLAHDIWKILTVGSSTSHGSNSGSLAAAHSMKVKSIASAGSPNQQEDHNPSHDEPVGDKLRELPFWARGGGVCHVIMLGILSIILYHVCKACMYIVKAQVEDDFWWAWAKWHMFRPSLNTVLPSLPHVPPSIIWSFPSALVGCPSTVTLYHLRLTHPNYP